jgi:hypothetical protein
MTFVIKNLIVISFLLINSKIIGQRKIIGAYQSNYAYNEEVIISLILNSDSTFIYCERTDLLNRSIIGNWNVKNNIVTLNNIHVDMNRNPFQKRDSSLLENLPCKYLIKNNKLFYLDENYKVIHRGYGYHSRIIYLLTIKNTYYIKKKIYLKKCQPPTSGHSQ